MSLDKKSRLTDYLLQSDQAVADLNINALYKRDVWLDLDRYVRQFLNSYANQWLILPGLRGVGKTTLLTQLYNHSSLVARSNVKRFYLSFEQLALKGFSVNDLVEALKYLRHTYTDQAFLICLDEVHFDSQWSLGCKVIFDQVDRIFLVCTGSSALSLRLNPDSARRANLIKVHPLSLPEFVAIKQLNEGLETWQQPPPDLSQRLRHGLFDALEPLAVYKALAACQGEVETYYARLTDNQPSNLEVLWQEYIQGYGSLPFTLLRTPSASPPLAGYNLKPVAIEDIKARVLRTLQRTLTEDVLKLLTGPSLGVGPSRHLQTSTVSLLPKLVNILANSERISLRKIAKNLGDVQIRTLHSLLEILIQSDIIVEVPAAGAARSRSTKTSKYLFAAPALRRALTYGSLSATALTADYDRRLKDRLLEDTILMQLSRIFSHIYDRRLIEYDSRTGGADFIITPDGLSKHSIVVEVGYQKTNARQVKHTLKAGGRYGLVITVTDKFGLDLDSQAVFVPLKYFLLT